MSRVALIGENSVEYVNALLDIWNNGDCAVLIDWRIPFQTAVKMMNEAKVHTCYIEKKLLDKMPVSLSESITFISFERKVMIAEYLPESVYDKFKPNYSNDEAIVLYSSGTTGKSKGIILSHYAININADAIIDYMKPNATDHIYIAKTLSHSSTLTGELLVSLKTHTKLVIAPTIMPPRYMLSNISKFNVTIICLNPTLLSMLVNEIQTSKYYISSLKKIYVSGSVLNDKIYEKAHKVLKNTSIYNVYGLSEAGPRVTAQREGCCGGNSVGKPIVGTQVAIIDEKGNILSHGNLGIIHVSTRSIFNHYVCGETKHESLYQGWLNTGDIGYIDSNKELHVVDRSDDVIILNSHKIYPSEIEKVILDSNHVSDCVVVNIKYNDNEFIGCLYVGDIVSEQEIKNELRSKLPTYEIPRRFIRRESVPRTLNGKISRPDIQAIILETIEME